MLCTCVFQGTCLELLTDLIYDGHYDDDDDDDTNFVFAVIMNLLIFIMMKGLILSTYSLSN